MNNFSSVKNLFYVVIDVPGTKEILEVTLTSWLLQNIKNLYNKAAVNSNKLSTNIGTKSERQK